MMTDIKSPLLGKTLNELQSVVLDLGMPKFTAKQIASWLFERTSICSFGFGYAKVYRKTDCFVAV